MGYLHKTISLDLCGPTPLHFDETFPIKDGQSIRMEGRERRGMTFCYSNFDALGRYRVTIVPIDHVSLCNEGLMEVRFYKIIAGQKNEIGYFLANIQHENGAYTASEMEIHLDPAYRNKGLVSQAVCAAQKYILPDSRFVSHVGNMPSIRHLTRSLPALGRWPLQPLLWILSISSGFYVGALGLCVLALFKARLESALLEKTLLGKIFKKAGFGDLRAEIIFQHNRILPVKLPFLKLSGRKL